MQGAAAAITEGGEAIDHGPGVPGYEGSRGCQGDRPGGKGQVLQNEHCPGGHEWGARRHECTQQRLRETQPAVNLVDDADGEDALADGLARPVVGHRKVEQREQMARSREQRAGDRRIGERKHARHRQDCGNEGAIDEVCRGTAAKGRVTRSGRLEAQKRQPPPHLFRCLIDHHVERVEYAVAARHAHSVERGTSNGRPAAAGFAPPGDMSLATDGFDGAPFSSTHATRCVMTVEFWTSGAGVPIANVRQAEAAEREGWDGIVYVDSQNLTGDPYIAMALAAKVTEKLKLGTGVTNPWTRHPAVTASAIATVQAESDGRAFLGIGRGDSALAHIGLAPAPVAVLEDYLRRLQGYLRGEEVEFGPEANVEKLRLANAPTASRLAWLRPSQPKVPVDVAATGPKVIAAAARHADAISFALGASPDRIAWGIETARAARRAAGLSPDMAWGAYVPCIVHDDIEAGRRLGEGGLSLFARFSVMHGEVVGPATEEQRRTLETIHRSYDMLHHAQAGSAQAGVLTNEFAEEFGIIGPPGYCIDRFRQLMALGVERFIVVGPSQGADRNEAARARARFVEEVLPALRS